MKTNLQNLAKIAKKKEQIETWETPNKWKLQTFTCTEPH